MTTDVRVNGESRLFRPQSESCPLVRGLDEARVASWIMVITVKDRAATLANRDHETVPRIATLRVTGASQRSPACVEEAHAQNATILVWAVWLYVRCWGLCPGGLDFASALVEHFRKHVRRHTRRLHMDLRHGRADLVLASSLSTILEAAA